MKIIISETFEKKFLTKFKKYFSIEDFINSLQKYKIWITLKDPYFKIKLKINLVDFRWVILLIENEKIIPISIYLKKDKNSWENIIWTNHKKEILFLQEKISKDLEKWKFKLF